MTPVLECDIIMITVAKQRACLFRFRNGERNGRAFCLDRKEEQLISLYHNVAEYFEESHKKWRAAVEAGDPLAQSPRWVKACRGNLEAAEYWRAKAKKLEAKLT